MIKKSWAMLKIITILLIIVILLKLCLVFLWPFIISIIFVLILEPFVKLFKNIGLSRRVSVFLGFIIMVITLVLFFYYIGSYVYEQVVIFINSLPNIIVILSNKFEFINFNNMNLSNIINTLENIIPSYKERIIGTVINTINGLIYTLVILLTTIFISLDLDKIYSLLKKYMPYNYFKIIYNVVKSNAAIINIQFKLVLITTLETIFGLYVLGIPSPLTIGLICGILDIMPVIGTTIIFVPLIVFEISQNNIFTTLGLVLLYILLTVSRKIMEVKMMGNNLHIHPAVTILSLYIGIIIYGAWGVIIGPFVIILLKEILNVFCIQRKV
ncbi:MAG: family transporter [Clostridiales bacterium]|jgi:predicted PurR-regulated permease PerM|nr:family transporter [Clostridiales bacterium]